MSQTTKNKESGAFRYQHPPSRVWTPGLKDTEEQAPPDWQLNSRIGKLAFRYPFKPL